MKNQKNQNINKENQVIYIINQTNKKKKVYYLAQMKKIFFKK